MKKLLITLLVFTFLLGLGYFLYNTFLRSEPEVAIPVDVTAPPGEENYRKTTFFLKESSPHTEYFVKIDYLEIEEVEQYLIMATDSGDPADWMTQERIPLSTKLEEGKEYNVVTKSFDKNLVNLEEEYNIIFNDYTISTIDSF